MAKKTYRTFYLKSLCLRFPIENDKRLEVVFRGGIQIDSTAKFTTSDEKVQSLLESASGFGKLYYIESEVENAPAAGKEEAAKPKKAEKAAEPEKPLVDIKDSRRFRNLVEMRNAIKELGIDIADNCSYADAKAIAQKEGYDFQIKR